MKDSFTCFPNDLGPAVPWKTFSVICCRYPFTNVIGQNESGHDTTWLQAALARIYRSCRPDCTLSVVNKLLSYNIDTPTDEPVVSDQHFEKYQPTVLSDMIFANHGEY